MEDEPRIAICCCHPFDLTRPAAEKSRKSPTWSGSRRQDNLIRKSIRITRTRPLEYDKLNYVIIISLVLDFMNAKTTKSKVLFTLQMLAIVFILLSCSCQIHSFVCSPCASSQLPYFDFFA